MNSKPFEPIYIENLSIVNAFCSVPCVPTIERSILLAVLYFSMISILGTEVKNLRCSGHCIKVNPLGEISTAQYREVA